MSLCQNLMVVQRYAKHACLKFLVCLILRFFLISEKRNLFIWVTYSYFDLPCAIFVEICYIFKCEIYLIYIKISLMQLKYFDIYHLMFFPLCIYWTQLKYIYSENNALFKNRITDKNGHYSCITVCEIKKQQFV
jgi:hypothetical protein